MILLIEILINLFILLLLIIGPLHSNELSTFYYGFIATIFFIITLIILLLILLKKFNENYLLKNKSIYLINISKTKWMQNLLYIMVSIIFTAVRCLLNNHINLNIWATFLMYLAILYMPFLLIGLFTSLIFIRDFSNSSNKISTLLYWLLTIPPGMDLLMLFLAELNGENLD